MTYRLAVTVTLITSYYLLWYSEELADDGTHENMTRR
jgi:hypothetical protein